MWPLCWGKWRGDVGSHRGLGFRSNNKGEWWIQGWWPSCHWFVTREASSNCMVSISWQATHVIWSKFSTRRLACEFLWHSFIFLMSIGGRGQGSQKGSGVNSCGLVVLNPTMGFMWNTFPHVVRDAHVAYPYGDHGGQIYMVPTMVVVGPSIPPHVFHNVHVAPTMSSHHSGVQGEAMGVYYDGYY